MLRGMFPTTYSRFDLSTSGLAHESFLLSLSQDAFLTACVAGSLVAWNRGLSSKKVQFSSPLAAAGLQTTEPDVS
jgi:hypothetical protein